MTLSQKIAAALDASPNSPPCTVSAETDEHRLALQLTVAGPVGLAFDALDFVTRTRPEWSPEALKGWGDRLVARLTYLMEPLVVLEHDPIAGEVELRSQTPTAKAERHAYYEVRLNRQGVLRLSRVAFDDTTRRRQPAPCHMTLEVIERLTDDLVASVA